MSTHADVLLEIIRSDAEEIEHHRREIIRLGAHRSTAAWFLHEQGWGYGRIAKSLGVSRPRAQQLVKAGQP